MDSETPPRKVKLVVRDPPSQSMLQSYIALEALTPDPNGEIPWNGARLRRDMLHDAVRYMQSLLSAIEDLQSTIYHLKHDKIDSEESE